MRGRSLSTALKPRCPGCKVILGPGKTCTRFVKCRKEDEWRDADDKPAIFAMHEKIINDRRA